MTANPWISGYVDIGDFTGLFVEALGWNRPGGRPRSVSIAVEDSSYTLTEAASYKGVVIWECPAVPSGPAQRAVDRKLRSESAERVVIFHDGHRQVWRWPQARDAAGAGAPRLVSHEHVVGRPNEALSQRLKFIKIDLDGPDITVLELVRRLRRAFDSEKVTKSFYTKFAEQHRDLTEAIEGIEVSDEVSKPELRWYGSILLNRLMFIYFMQRKGFLDGDHDYLRNRMQKVRDLARPGSFYEFYTDFLVPLFHEGLGADTGSRAISDSVIEKLLGDIPYINGGIFAKHPLELSNDIRIPDEAFERVFDFFDQWQWHLDDRPTGNPNEINPDVLGYIFEQFVNNREEVAKGDKDAATNVDKGAYYTKEDVTGFMTANALVPTFLERLNSKTGVNVWRGLSQDPKRYVWPSLAHGCDIPLPEEISDNFEVFPRPTWDSLPVPTEIGLPHETWWEVVDRRNTFSDVIARISRGDIADGDAVIEANIDVELLAVDVIDALDSPSDVVSAWECLTSLKILDPTCGSGAFLFAALNVLHRLYGGVLEVAEVHARTNQSAALTKLVESQLAHPNRDYFLLKHSVLHNIYGVDLMHEAVEIARLRLFLKLISQVTEKRDIKPLPDLDFNIRAGNALVGASSVNDILDRVDLLSREQTDTLLVSAHSASAAFRDFSDLQEQGTHEEVQEAKERVGEQIGRLKSQLNEWWWASDGGSDNQSEYTALTQPMHWLVEFPEAMVGGGFDVVIGNPPYVPRREVLYPIDDFVTRDLPDIYAPCLERALQLLKPDGRLAMITPHSLMQSRNFRVLRRQLVSKCGAICCSAFARIPSGLFENDVRVRNSIVLARRSEGGTERVSTSRCRRWYSDARPHVMPLIRYVAVSGDLDHWPFVDDARLLRVFDKIRRKSAGSLAQDVAPTDPTAGSRTLFYKSNAYNYLSIALEPVPVINADGSKGETSAQKALFFESEAARNLAYVFLAGKLGFVWWTMSGDDFNLTKGVLESMPGGHRSAPSELRSVAADWTEKLNAAQAAATVWKRNKGKKIGNWDLSACRHVTDQSDLAILRAVECTADEVAAVWTAYERAFMSGSD